jgi:prefoldin subunit 5
MSQEERFDRIDASIARLDASVVRIDASSARIEANIGRLTQHILDFREETVRHLEVIDNRLDVLTATVSSIDSRIPALTKALLEFGITTTQLTNDHARNKNATAELASRMDRLDEKVSKIISPAA